MQCVYLLLSPQDVNGLTESDDESTRGGANPPSWTGRSPYVHARRYSSLPERLDLRPARRDWMPAVLEQHLSPVRRLVHCVLRPRLT